MALSHEMRVRLEDAEYQARLRIRRELERRVRGSWLALERLGGGEFERWMSTTLALVQAGKRSVAYIVSARLAMALETIPEPVVAAAMNPRGVPDFEVYSRPKDVLYRNLAKGVPLGVALEKSANRLSSLVRTDLQLANTNQARASLSAGGVKAYRRVLHGAENCALCVVVSTRKYRTSELMPIHPGCDCSVQEILVSRDQPAVLDDKLLEEVRSLADQRGLTTSDRKELMNQVVVKQHGEYGPTLAWKNHHFETA